MHLSPYESQYNSLIRRVLDTGYSDKGSDVRTVYEDGCPAYTVSLTNESLLIPPSLFAPILTQKFVGVKTATKEMLWIWRDKSNNVDELNKMGVTIWDEWKLPDGTIGRAYGYQLGKICRRVKTTPLLWEMIRNREISNFEIDSSGSLDYIYLDQVDYLIYTLKFNPESRRIITTLWDVNDLDSMSLQPCVWNTHWMVKGGKLFLTVGIRSNDLALGNSFNVLQYYILQRMIAQVTGYDIGDLVFNIDDAHIYDRHVEGLIDQLERDSFSPPMLMLNPEIKSFYDFTADDVKLVDYKHSGKIEYEVAK